MSKPTTKPDLISAATAQFDKLWGQIALMRDEQATFVFPESVGKEAHWQRDKNLRDVLMHLYEWHQLLLDWVDANQNDNPQPFLPPPYNWKTYGEMNQRLWEQNQTTTLEVAKRLLRESHQDVLVCIDSFTDEELFTKKFFKWTGNSTLGSYCVSATSGHYDWASKKIKAAVLKR